MKKNKLFIVLLFLIGALCFNLDAQIPKIPHLIPWYKNWCWMASAIQCLHRVMPFREKLSSFVEQQKIEGKIDTPEILLQNLFDVLVKDENDAKKLKEDIFQAARSFYDKIFEREWLDPKYKNSVWSTQSFLVCLLGFIFTESLNKRTTSSQERLKYSSKVPFYKLGFEVKYPHPFNLNVINPIILFKDILEIKQNGKFSGLTVMQYGTTIIVQDPPLDHFANDIVLNKKVYQLVACVTGGGGHAKAYVKYDKWYCFNSMKCLVDVDFDQNTSPMVVENISATVNASIKKWSQKEKNKLVDPGKRVIIAFYEQVDEPPLSPLQQRLLDLRTSLQQLKIKLSSLKEKLEELTRGLSIQT